MSDHTMSKQPRCMWVKVTDADGSTRMEARWWVPAETSQPAAA